MPACLAFANVGPLPRQIGVTCSPRDSVAAALCPTGVSRAPGCVCPPNGPWSPAGGAVASDAHDDEPERHAGGFTDPRVIRRKGDRFERRALGLPPPWQW